MNIRNPLITLLAPLATAFAHRFSGPSGVTMFQGLVIGPLTMGSPLCREYFALPCSAKIRR